MDMSEMNNVINMQRTPMDLVRELNQIINKVKNCGDNAHLLKKADEIAEQIIDITCQTYENVWERYKEVRGNKIKEIDNICWETLNKYIDIYFSCDRSKINILDVATGNGRDIIYGQSLGYNVVGVDNCEGFINLLSQHCANGLIKPNSYKKCDMRSLVFPDCSFEVVRHNASLLHLPLIGKGYTVDLAISEAYRVLKPDGLLYIFVKEGTTLELNDTNERLGGRIFQFFSHQMLNEVVNRNGFTIVHTSDEIEIRDSSTINWILLIAQKNEMV